MHSCIIYRRLMVAVRKAGIPYHPRLVHTLRHSFATMCINKGIPLAVVSRWLGHTSISTTMIYAHHDTRESARWSQFFDGGTGHD
jgi:integrase